MDPRRLTMWTQSDSVTPDVLLAIPANRPDQLFSGDEEADRKLYWALALAYHPDRHPGRAEAFKHLGELKAQRDRQIAEHRWPGAGIRELKLAGGKRLRIRYLRNVPFELGNALIATHSVTYLLREEHRALYQHAVRTIRHLPFENDAMRAEARRFLPHIELEAETSAGPALVLRKPPHAARLRDVLDHLGGRVNPRHVAWILSTLHNVGAYLSWAGLTHNAISLETVFVSPAHHSGMLLGGWWYARPAGERIAHLPGPSADLWQSILPHHLTAAGRATPRLDRELIRLAGRTLLGDAGGMRLLRDPAIPRALRTWVTSPGDDDGIVDYANWARTREAAFGPRKFVVMDLTPREIYGAP
ncbi:MAG TPA: hypothetical protein VFJ16_27605 [Longimicrobium sp.]|nr:hypothetical protein [Longimicrobium sp.]